MGRNWFLTSSSSRALTLAPTLSFTHQCVRDLPFPSQRSPLFFKSYRPCSARDGNVLISISQMIPLIHVTLTWLVQGGKQPWQSLTSFSVVFQRSSAFSHPRPYYLTHLPIGQSIQSLLGRKRDSRGSSHISLPLCWPWLLGSLQVDALAGLATSGFQHLRKC